MGLLFFPEPTRNIAGLGFANIKPAFELAIYFSQGILDIARGIVDAMFT